jgi:SAM-dependent methyltransferase
VTDRLAADGAPGIGPHDSASLAELESLIDAEGRVRFTCNLCAADGAAMLAELGRERPTCPACSSTGRHRAVAVALERRFLEAGEHVATSPRRQIAGLGMSDMPQLAGPLARAFAYTNTFLHREPFLDLTALPERAHGSVDFVVCSEVLEHVEPPVERAVAALHRLLRPGGLLVLTTPYSFEPATVEHFPELHDYRIEQGPDGLVLRNRTRAGVEQTFTDLVFHGGYGETLEMRLFAFSHLVALLQDAGFRDVSVEPPSFTCGAWWPEPWSRVLSATA